MTVQTSAMARDRHGWITIAWDCSRNAKMAATTCTPKRLSSSRSSCRHSESVLNVKHLKGALATQVAVSSEGDGGLSKLNIGGSGKPKRRAQVYSEGDGDLSKLSIGGGSKPTCRAKGADGSPTNWNPKGTLTNTK